MLFWILLVVTIILFIIFIVLLVVTVYQIDKEYRKSEEEAAEAIRKMGHKDFKFKDD